MTSKWEKVLADCAGRELTKAEFITILHDRYFFGYDFGKLDIEKCIRDARCDCECKITDA